MLGSDVLFVAEHRVCKCNAEVDEAHDGYVARSRFTSESHERASANLLQLCHMSHVAVTGRFCLQFDSLDVPIKLAYAAENTLTCSQ